MIKCQIPKCENDAFMAYGNRWICGRCFELLQKKELKRKNEMMEDLL